MTMSPEDLARLEAWGRREGSTYAPESLVQRQVRTITCAEAVETHRVGGTVEYAPGSGSPPLHTPCGGWLWLGEGGWTCLRCGADCGGWR